MISRYSTALRSSIEAWMSLGEQAETAVLTMIRQGVDLSALISEQARLPRVCPYKIGKQEWSWWIQEEEPRLAALGVIEPAEEGLWPTSSGFFVPKKSKFRLVLDLRPLNLLTPKEELTPPLPRVPDLLPRLASGSHLFVVDLKDAFYAVAYADTRRDLRCFGLQSSSGEQRFYVLRCLAMGW